MKKDFITNAELMSDSQTAGFIYILSNPSYKNCVKIGMTTKLPGYRVAELSSGTAVPTPFSMEYCQFVSDVNEMEKIIHESLKDHRTSDDREFFDLPILKAIEKVDAIIDGHYMSYYNNKTYRKIQDAQWAMYFDVLEIPFEYCSEPVKIADGMTFMADFFLPDQDCWLIIDEYIFKSNAGRQVALNFAKKTGKLVFRFFECRPDLDSEHYYGSFISPDGSFEGCMQFGICEHCGSKHFGHFGCPDLFVGEGRSTSKNNCQCYRHASFYDELINKYSRLREHLTNVVRKYS